MGSANAGMRLRAVYFWVSALGVANLQKKFGTAEIYRKSTAINQLRQIIDSIFRIPAPVNRQLFRKY